MDRKLIVALYVLASAFLIAIAVEKASAQTSGPSTSLAPATSAVGSVPANNFALTIKEKPAGALTAALAGAGAGNVENGSHLYRVTFVTAEGQTNAATSSGSVSVVDKTLDGKVSLSSIPTGSVFVTARKVYRTVAGGSVFKLLTTISDNSTTTFTDNVADASLTTTAPTNNTTANPVLSYTGATGVTKVGGASVGTVTSVSGASGQISVTNPTTTPVVFLASVAGVSGSYTNANITVDAKGRISAAANGSAGITNSAPPNTIPKTVDGIGNLGASQITDDGNDVNITTSGGNLIATGGVGSTSTITNGTSSIEVSGQSGNDRVNLVATVVSAAAATESLSIDGTAHTITNTAAASVSNVTPLFQAGIAGNGHLKLLLDDSNSTIQMLLPAGNILGVGGGGNEFQIDTNGKIVKYGGTAPGDGEILIGDTAGVRFTRTTLNPGTGISVTNGAGSITIAQDNTGLGAILAVPVNNTVLATATGTVFSSPGNDGTALSIATEGNVSFPVTRAGTIRNLFVRTGGTAKVNTPSTVITIRKNGVDTAVTLTMTQTVNTTTSDTTHSFTVVAGDLITVSFATTGAAGVSTSIAGVSFELD